MAGDFNDGDIDWDKLVIEHFLSILGEAGHHQLQKSTTHEDAVLDQFGTNKQGSIQSIHIPGISDHGGVIIVSTAVGAQEHTTQSTYLWPLLLTWFNFNPSMDK